MSDKLKSAPLSQHKYDLTVILFSYAVFAFIFGSAYRYAMNPDGISELRLAEYLSEGHFMRSVVSGWCPLNIWGMSLFLLPGLDGLTAARTAIACYGAGMILVIWFLSSRFDLSDNTRFVAVLTSALLISFWTVQFIAADVLIAALILCYIYVITNDQILTDNKISFLCGVVAGISYMAHHYALPFFMVHFPLMLLLKGYFHRDKERFPAKKILISWLTGMAAFLMIASIWIGIMSVKYGRLTISSKGGAAHAIMGPKDVDRRHPFFVGGLYKPRDAYAMHVFEDPSEVKFRTWSPFESREYFLHQLTVIKDNTKYISDHFVNNSPFFTKAFVVGTLIFFPIAFLLNSQNSRKNFLYAWVIMTFSIYCSGFILLIARSPRRFYAPMILFLLLAFHFLEELQNVSVHIPSGRRGKLLTVYLLIILISAFALKPGIHLIKSLRSVIAAEQVNPYKDIAEQIKDNPFPSPYAILRSAQKPHTDTYIAYYLGKQLLGRPLSRDAEGLARELKAAGAKTLLVFDNPEIMETLKNDKNYVHTASRKLRKDSRYLRAINIEQDNIQGWDEEVNIFTLN